MTRITANKRLSLFRVYPHSLTLLGDIYAASAKGVRGANRLPERLAAYHPIRG